MRKRVYNKEENIIGEELVANSQRPTVAAEEFDSEGGEEDLV